MTIYSPSDTALLTIPFNTGCIRRRVLMKDDYITVKFSLAEPKHFGIGCYVSIPNEGRFEIIKEQKPTYNGTTGGYDYELTFCAEYLKWQNKIFFYSPENASREAAWSLTAPIDIHLGVFLRNLTANGFTYNGKAYSWTVDSTFDSAEAKFIQYNATNLIDALTAIADAWACEWWVTDNVIHFGACRVVSASKPPIEVSNGVNADISATESSAEYATRLYVFGSERNLPADYRKGDATLTVEGVVQRRLMLPEGTPYIDAKANMETAEIVEKVITIDSIYPKTNGKIAEVVPYVAKVTDENNNEVEQTFYRFKDASLTFSADYLLKDQTLGVIFTSGRLNGLQFDAVFNPNGVAEKLKDGNVNPDAQLFEIVANENYGLELPSGSMIPQAGDTYVLIGWDTTKIASLGLVAQAEAALLAEGRAQLTKMNVDPATYNCTIYADTAKAACATNSDGYIFPYGIGEPVMLKDNAYFSNGSRLSRIIGYEYPLDIPFDNPELIVGEAASYSRIGALESEVANIAMGGNTLSASGGSSNVYIIGTNDRTQPTNSNVYSALRTSKSFLSKTGDDRTTGKLNIDGGIEVNYGGWRKGARINKDGSAQFMDTNLFGDLLVYGHISCDGTFSMITGDIDTESGIYNTSFSHGFDGYGWEIRNHNSGVYHAEFDTLTIRKAMTVYELIIQKIRSVGGAIICSAANGKIKSVTTSGDNYVITFEDECQFQADDLMRCQTFTGGTLKSYWVRITSATTESVTVAKSEFGSATPEAGDECVLMGNATNDKRQSAIYISAAEDGRPVIDILNGIKSASTAGCLRGRFGALDGINDSAFPADRQPQGYGLYSDNAYLKGEFILASTGENVSTLFEATNGKITAEITSVKGEINKVQNNVDKVWQDTESALNVLDGDIQTNTTSINGLNQQIKDDYNKLNDGLSSLGDSIDEISGNLTDAEDRLNGKIDAANDKIAEVDGKVDTADGRITEITTNYEALSTRVEQTEANITLQAQSIKSVTTRVTQTESDINAANDRITETDKAVSEANEAISGANKAIGDLDAKVDANQEAITETITAMEARFNVRADEISSSVSAVTSEVTTVKTTVESVQSDVSSVTTKVEDVTTKVDNVTTAVEDVTTEVNTVKTDVNTVKSDVSTVKGEVSTVKTDVGSIQTDVKTAQDAIEKAQTDIANVDKSITNINGDITTINGSITTINGNIDDINGNIDTVNGSLGTLRTDLESNVKTLNGEISRVENYAAGLDSKIDTNKDAFDEFKTDTNAQFGTVNDSIAGVNKNVTDLETATNDKIAGVNSSVADLKTNTDKSIQNINDNLAGVNGEIEQVRGTANTANTTANNASTKADAAQNTADNAQKTADDANTKADDVAKQQVTITETITAMKSDFSVRADKIESQVTKVSKSISSSGRNMLLNTNQGTTNWRYADNSGVAYTQTSTERGGYRITRPSAGRKATWERFDYALRPQLIIAGQKYTVSFKATNNTSETAKTQFNIYIANQNSTEALTNSVRTEIVTGNEEALYVVTLEAKANGAINGTQVLNIFPHGDCMNQWLDIEIRDLQLERGEVATEYLPSDEDIVNETKEALSSSISQTASSIRTEVTKVSSSISSSGRNMLLATNQGTTNWTYNDNSGITNTRTATANGGIKVTRPSANRKATWERFNYALRPQLIVAGQKYTVSFKLTNSTSDTAKTQFDVFIANQNSTGLLTSKVRTQEITGTKETLFVITLEATASGTADGSQFLNFTPCGDCMNNWTDIEIRDLQLERGEMATEYMPSNEDYVDETKKVLTSSINQTAESINLSVTSLESNVNAMQDEVDSAKSEVNAINSGLKTTGIDIKTGKVTISADEVTFTNSSGTKQALLTNGKINAKALESESLTVQNAVNANQRIEVLPQTGKFGVNIYNGSSLVQSLTADTYNNGASDLFAEEIGALSINNPSGSASTGIASTTSSLVVLLSPRMTSTPRTVFITGGTLSATAKCSIPATSSSGLQQTYLSSAAISLDLQHSSTSAFTSDVTTINLVATQAQVSSVGVTSAQSQTSTVNAVNAMGVVPAGRYYRIVVSFVKSANGTPASTNSASVSWSGISAQNWSHEYISRHFANGIVLGSSLKDYFDVHYSNDTLSMRMETGGSGLLIQSKTDEYTNDMATLIGGYQAPMQRLICHGFVKYIAESGYKMHYHGLRINNGSAVSLKYPSGGTYRTMLAFSDDFKALLERLLGDDYTENNNADNEHYCGLEKHLFCCINTRSATNVRAVTSLTTDGFITDALGAYEDFTFDIYFV